MRRSPWSQSESASAWSGSIASPATLSLTLGSPRPATRRSPSSTPPAPPRAGSIPLVAPTSSDPARKSAENLLAVPGHGAGAREVGVRVDAEEQASGIAERRHSVHREHSRAGELGDELMCGAAAPVQEARQHRRDPRRIERAEGLEAVRRKARGNDGVGVFIPGYSQQR